MTKKEIQYKINQLNRQLTNYQNEKNDYSTSLSYANKLVASLNSGLNNLKTSNDNLKKYFTINGKTVASDNIESACNELQSSIKELTGVIIPGINKEIKNLSSKIYNIQIQISNLRRQYANATE